LNGKESNLTGTTRSGGASGCGSSATTSATTDNRRTSTSAT
jgi:hypothetical protein